MKAQNGWTLVTSLVFLLMITVITVYTLEGSNIQSKMVANSLTTTLTYQECRNEQEAQLLRYNSNKADLGTLLSIAGVPEDEIFADTLATLNTAQTELNNTTPPKSTITVSWSYVKEAPARRGGYNIDTESQFKSYLYETNCEATYSLNSNSQTLGAVANGLRQAGIMN